MATKIKSNILGTLMPGPFSERSPLITGRGYYKPFAYPELYDRWDTHERMHWLPSEVPMHEDIKDWNTKLDDNERAFLTNVFRFFTQGDIDVAGSYYTQMIPAFCKTPEAAMFLGSIAAREGVHVAAYSHLIESLSMPESTYKEFLEYSEMCNKQKYVKEFQNSFKVRYDILWSFLTILFVLCLMIEMFGWVATLLWCPFLVIYVTNLTSTLYLERVSAGIALFSGFTEGMQLFSSFAMLLAFSKTGVMRGMGDIVQWSVTDETMHTRGMISLFKIFVNENREPSDDIMTRVFGKKWSTRLLGPRGIRIDLLENTVRRIAIEMVELEDKFIDLAYNSLGEGTDEMRGLERSKLKKFIRFIADVRMEDMNFSKIYNIPHNPLPDFETMLNAPVVTNFFEQRSTDYAKPMNHNWNKVWGNRRLFEEIYVLKNFRRRTPSGDRK